MILMAAVLLLTCPAALGREAVPGEVEEAVGVADLERAAGAYLDGYLDVGAVEGENFASGVESIWEGSRGELPGVLAPALRRGVALLAVALLCALAGEMEGRGEGLDPVRLCGAAAVTAVACADVGSLLSLGRETMERMSGFCTLLLPTVTAASAAAGLTASSAARHSATLLFLDLLLTVVERLLLPLVYGYVAATAAGYALDNAGLRRLGEMLKRVSAGLLALLLTGFVFYLTLSGAVAGKADAVVQKAAKTALSGAVPVVGGILSDAAETVVAGAGILRGTVGVVGMLTVFAICLVPFLTLGCRYLVYRGIAVLAETACPGPVTGLIGDLGSAFALVLGMVGSEAVILYVALLTSIQAVSG